MKKFLVLALAFSLILPSVALAAGGEVQDIGSWSDPVTGEIFKFVNAKSNDSFRQNQSVIYVMHTSIQKDEKSGKWAPKTNLLVRDAATSDGFWNNFGKGGAAGLFQAGGLIGFGALVRPSPTNIDNSGSGAGSTVGDGAAGGFNTGTGSGPGGLTVNATGTGGAGGNAVTGPITNVNTALGGAGGKGGSVIAPGGIGNKTKITNSFNKTSTLTNITGDKNKITY